jgi:hypothetical protein
MKTALLFLLTFAGLADAQHFRLRVSERGSPRGGCFGGSPAVGEFQFRAGFYQQPPPLILYFIQPQAPQCSPFQVQQGYGGGFGGGFPVLLDQQQAGYSFGQQWENRSQYGFPSTFGGGGR